MIIFYHFVLAKLLKVAPFNIKGVPFGSFAVKDITGTIGEI